MNTESHHFARPDSPSSIFDTDRKTRKLQELKCVKAFTSPDPSLSIREAQGVARKDTSASDTEMQTAATSYNSASVSASLSPLGSLSFESAQESISAPRLTDMRSLRSSSRSLHSRTLPDEVLQIILARVGFPDLWGAAQYVCRAWRCIATRRVLASLGFLNLLLTTNFQAFEYTFSGFQEDSSEGPQDPDDEDHCWPGVGIDSEALAKDFPEVLTTEYCQEGSPLRLHLLPQKLSTNRSGHPFAIDCALVPLHDIHTESQFQLVRAVKVCEVDTVLLKPLSFSADTGRIVIDMTQCYVCLYRIYLNVQSERRELTDLLEADLWRRWANRYSKYWGKKEAGKYFPGVFIDHVDGLLAKLDQGWPSLPSLLERWDLLLRKQRSLQDLSLSRTPRFRSDARLHTMYRLETPTWHDPVESGLRSDISKEYDQYGNCFKVIVKRQTANFARTFAAASCEISPYPGRSSILNFLQRDDKCPQNYLSFCMPDEDYHAMFREWYASRMRSLNQPILVRQTLAYVVSPSESDVGSDSETGDPIEEVVGQEAQSPPCSSEP